MDSEEFCRVAEETFSGKVMIQSLTVKLDAAELARLPWTKEEIEAYPKQVWVMDGQCPVCGAELGAFFGSFQWGLVHGEGFCSQCNKAAFRYYHYIVKGKRPLLAYALIGF
jgi:hypothetical protein